MVAARELFVTVVGTVVVIDWLSMRTEKQRDEKAGGNVKWLPHVGFSSLSSLVSHSHSHFFFRKEWTPFRLEKQDGEIKSTPNHGVFVLDLTP